MRFLGLIILVCMITGVLIEVRTPEFKNNEDIAYANNMNIDRLPNDGQVWIRIDPYDIGIDSIAAIVRKHSEQHESLVRIIDVKTNNGSWVTMNSFLQFHTFGRGTVIK